MTDNTNETIESSPVDDVKLKKPPIIFNPNVIAIASSTGGPRVLDKILRGLKGKNINIPIFITQHMPADFTTLLAEQLRESTKTPCVEGEDGLEVEEGKIYIAPGDFHMIVQRSVNDKVIIRLNQDPPENFCRPAADPMLLSIEKVYGAKKILAVVLTGMGNDGKKACQLIANGEGVVIAQDQASSSVWGMPGAVANAGLCTHLYSDDDMAQGIIDMSGGKIY